MAKDEKWFKSIKWDEGCLICHQVGNGTCPVRGCAELSYDDNGNRIPISSVRASKEVTDEAPKCCNENAAQVKLWEIVNCTYGDVCSDSWFGKESNSYTIGFVSGTEENVKSLVAEINANRNSYYSKPEPEDEWDSDFEDADYVTYTEVTISTFDEIRSNPMIARAR